MPKICWFQLLRCGDLLLFYLLYYPFKKNLKLLSFIYFMQHFLIAVTVFVLGHHCPSLFNTEVSVCCFFFLFL